MFKLSVIYNQKTQITEIQCITIKFIYYQIIGFAIYVSEPKGLEFKGSQGRFMNKELNQGIKLVHTYNTKDVHQEKLLNLFKNISKNINKLPKNQLAVFNKLKQLGVYSKYHSRIYFMIL
jgi:hypothetical protein